MCLCSFVPLVEMPVIEEVNDDAGSGHSASHSGAGDHAQTDSSGSASPFSRLMVKATLLICLNIHILDAVQEMN